MYHFLDSIRNELSDPQPVNSELLLLLYYNMGDNRRIRQ